MLAAVEEPSASTVSAREAGVLPFAAIGGFSAVPGSLSCSGAPASSGSSSRPSTMSVPDPDHPTGLAAHRPGAHECSRRELGGSRVGQQFLSSDTHERLRNQHAITKTGPFHEGSSVYSPVLRAPPWLHVCCSPQLLPGAPWQTNADESKVIAAETPTYLAWATVRRLGRPPALPLPGPTRRAYGQQRHGHTGRRRGGSAWSHGPVRFELHST